MTVNSYAPIIKKIAAWIDYEKCRPKSDYVTNRQEHDVFRMKNDLDSVLLNGDLNADTIFSLWIPLRLALVRINRYSALKKYGNINNKIAFLEAILNEQTIAKLLPKSNETVSKLLKLFDLGQEKCNVMSLKERRMQSRGGKPYYDYMPYFLFECFDNGAFSRCFTGNCDLIEWIIQQNLNMFFEGEITKDNIKDLSGSGDLTKGIPQNLDYLLDNYIAILEQRKRLID